MADSALSQSEFAKLVRTYREDLSEQQCRQLFSLVNSSRSGSIGLEEFVAYFGPKAAQVEEPWVRNVIEVVSDCLSPARTGLSIEEVFSRLDCLEEADDSLSLAEFGKMIRTYRPDLQEGRVKRLFAFVNASGSGKITLSEFNQVFGAEAELAPAGLEEPWVRQVLEVVSDCLSATRSGLPIEEVFRRLDGWESEDNSLSRPEFDRMIQSYRPDVTRPQLARLFSLVNSSGSGKVGFEEFCACFDKGGGRAAGKRTAEEEPWMSEALDLVSSCLSEVRTGLPLEEVFRRLEGFEEADGSLSQNEFDRMMLTYRPELSQEQRKKLFSRVNTSGSGKVSFDEFKRRFGPRPPRSQPTAARQAPGKPQEKRTAGPHVPASVAQPQPPKQQQQQHFDGAPRGVGGGGQAS